MKIGNNEIFKTAEATPANINSTNSREIMLFKTEEQNQVVKNNTTQGLNADVETGNTKTSAIPGFAKQQLQIRTLQGQTFNINLFIQGSADPEKVKQLSEKLTKTLSNLPANILEDMQKECNEVIDYSFISYVYRFNKTHRKRYYELLENVEKEFLIIKKRKDIDKLL